MEGPWSIKHWTPSNPGYFPGNEEGPDEEVEFPMPINSANAQCPMFSQDFYGWSSIIQDLTTKLQCLPYNPLTWFSRGIGLYKIGYPELCVGDMHRARLFVEAALARTTEFRNEALLVYGLELWLEEPTWAIRGLDGFEQHVKSSLRKLEKNNMDIGYSSPLGLAGFVGRNSLARSVQQIWSSMAGSFQAGHAGKGDDDQTTPDWK